MAIIPGDGLETASISLGTLSNLDSSLVDISGGLIMDTQGNTIALGGGIMSNDAIVTTTLLPSDEVVATYDPANGDVITVTLTPSAESSSTYSSANDPTTVVWG